ncbi:PHP domain-containing protein [Actinosynnema pretiosum subsp. pretiosum]|uniref:PHP domain protein n=2 Tax=Actinosynnema TaxID=40566 RepID=C6WM47_ACTMD|nr:PHP domain-containing protein [Actinosynnema mirum]ACU34781.1 PHP domain protein [Actinosynnema mirum DSM 43827]AXX28144.1 putative metal-dependent phosphoesterases (PHP family) [Actinosynnema pretiosum subsp. pretiosum]QUF07474.1 PHP domain-containing protein [Actinosynnema pretiosum subsp. pretiosum]
MRIDLHTHSTESDGTDTPAGLVAAAADAGLHAIAITDHDTAAGWAEAAAALPAGMRLVRGAELSCASDDGRGRVITVHLLAYLYDPTSQALVEEQQRLRLERRQRLRLMAERMREDGFPVDPDEMMASMPADAPAGRPHLAMALIRGGVVTSVDEAFARYLTSGRYYVPRTDTPVARAIQMIEDAGGVTVLAHPFAVSRGPVINEEVLASLAARGLAGVEVDHPDHDPATRTRVRGLARELGLLTTGSSDYHGTNKTTRIGAETTSPEVLDELADRATGCKVLTG